MLTARDAAKDFLRPYVERGDSVDSICSGGMGCARREYWAQIGGVTMVNGKTKHLKSHQLAVTELADKKCFVVFQVEELVAELRRQIEQSALWQESEVGAGQLHPLLQVNPPEKHENPCVDRFGAGPAGKTCAECRFFIGIVHSRTFYKCELRGVTNGPGTDHKRRWQACAKFEQRQGHMPLFDGRQ